MQTGFNNHKRIIRDRVIRAERASLVGAELWHYGGFPGTVLRAHQPGKVVYGQVLTFEPALWPEVLRELDTLEGFISPGHYDNMYERQLVRVRIHKELPEPDAAAAPGAGGAGAGGAGAMPAPASASASAAEDEAAAKAHTEAAEAASPAAEEVVREESAWVYETLIMVPGQVRIGHGDWRAYMDGLPRSQVQQHVYPPEPAPAPAAAEAKPEEAGAEAAAAAVPV